MSQRSPLGVAKFNDTECAQDFVKCILVKIASLFGAARIEYRLLFCRNNENHRVFDSHCSLVVQSGFANWQIACLGINRDCLDRAIFGHLNVSKYVTHTIN